MKKHWESVGIGKKTFIFKLKLETKGSIYYPLEFVAPFLCKGGRICKEFPIKSYIRVVKSVLR